MAISNAIKNKRILYLNDVFSSEANKIASSPMTSLIGRCVYDSNAVELEKASLLIKI